MNLVDLYSEVIANWLSGGNLINTDKLSALGIKTLYDRIVTKKYIKKVWCVFSIPVEYNGNLTYMLRRAMFKSNPAVKTLVHTYSTPVNINVQNEMFKRQFSKVSTDYDDYKTAFESMRNDEKQTGKVIRTGKGNRKIRINKMELDSYRDKYLSYSYVNSHVEKGGTFSETYLFIEAHAKTRKDLRNYKKNLVSFLRRENILFMELQGGMAQYLNNFCPAGYMMEDNKKYPTMLLSDENLAHLVPNYTRGLVGGYGTLLGKDWIIKWPFRVNFLESAAAQVNIIVGKSGSGKTFQAFTFCLSLLAEAIHCSAIDIKGKEWEKLRKFTKLLVIDMDDESGRFVNTLRLDDMKVTRENARELFKMAVTGTVQLLSILVNLQEKEGNIVDLEKVLEDAVIKLYNSREISPSKPSSFEKSKYLKFEDILPILYDLKNSNSYNDSLRALCQLAHLRCGSYFNSEGRYGAAFKNEVTLQEVLDTPLVIYSFNKNRDTTLNTLDTVRVFMAQYLDTKKQSTRKDMKLHTAAFYEELQRCDQFARLITAISHAVTGSRSNNVMIFLLLNALSVFDNQEMKPIKSNITTVIAGLLTTEDIETLSTDFDCEEIVPYLTQIKDNPKYTNCFAIKYDTGKHRDRGIFKVVVPKHIEEALSTKDVA